MRKKFLIGLKCGSMHASAAAAQFDRVSQVQHLVVNEVFHCVPGNVGTIKDAADHNGVVGRIIVSQALARVIGAPGHLRSRHQAKEKPDIQIFEDLFQIVVQTFGSMDFLAPSHLSDQVGLGRDALASGKLSEARGMATVDLFSVKLGDQDVKDGVEHIVACALQQVREAYQDASFAQTDGVVEVGKREELDFVHRKRSTRTQLPVGMLKKNRNSGVHRVQIIKNRGRKHGLNI